jgi:type IV pilus assembly protein PilN
MQITINLCTTPFVDREPLIRKLRFVMMSLGILTIGAGALLAVSDFRNRGFVAEGRQLDSAIVRQMDELGRYRKMLETPDNIHLADRTLALNSLFDEKSFSWTMLMKDFEGLVPPEVELASIQPNREKDGAISLKMHIVGPRERVVELIHALELSRNFSNPVVTGETARADARLTQHAAALMESTVEEFDVETGYDADALPPPPSRNVTTAVTQTPAIAAPASKNPVNSRPVQIATAIAPARPVR